MVLAIFITMLTVAITQGQTNTFTQAQANTFSNLLLNLITNPADESFRAGIAFKAGDRVSVPQGWLTPIDLSQNMGYYIYLVMKTNENSGQLKPFYIQTRRKLPIGIYGEINEPLLIEYVRTAQYLKNRIPKDTLLFKEVR